MGRALTPRVLTALGLGIVATACAGEPPADGPAADASTPAIRFRDALPIPESDPIACGAAVCTPPARTPLAPSACCGDAGGCGVSTAFSGGACIEGSIAGAPVVGCASLDVLDGVILQGCCTAEGECGVFDRFGELGCLPGVIVGRERSTCAPDTREACTALVEVYCDGPEDCPAGLRCCGRAQPDRYDAFGCFPDCATIVDDVRGSWREICHPGDHCPRPGDACESSDALPLGLGKCTPAGAAPGDAEAPEPRDAATSHDDVSIRCGDERCKAGEKCCLRPPHAAYCADANTPCSCDARAPTPTGPRDASIVSDASGDARL